MKVVDYRILLVKIEKQELGGQNKVSKAARHLRQEVETHLHSGWILQGGISITDTHMAQAMVLTRNDPDAAYHD